MTLEKEIAEAMEERAEWKGDSDALWQKVATGISLPEAQPKVQRRPAWRVPAWGAAAAAVAVVVGIWAVAPGGVPQTPTTPGAAPDATKSKGSANREPLDPKFDYKPPSAGLGHTYLGFGVDAAREIFQPGAPVQLHFQFQGGTDSPITILEDPKLVIVPLAAPYDFDHVESVLSASVGQVTVPGWKGKIVAPGETVSADVSWNPAQLPSGWYRVVLAPLGAELGGTVGDWAEGGDARFLVAYPAGALRLGRIEPGAQTVQHGVTLTVDRVTFTERSTKIVYHLTGVPGAMSLSVSLKRPEGPAGLVASGFEPSPDGVTGYAEFDPTLASSASLTISVPDVDGVKGPWIVTLPLH
jgi:hypothetical protein